MLFSHQALADAPELQLGTPLVSRWEVRRCVAKGHCHYFFDRETGRTSWSPTAAPDEEDEAGLLPPPSPQPRGVDSAANSPTYSRAPSAPEPEPLTVGKSRS
jgi:hypothetical protein